MAGILQRIKPQTCTQSSASCSQCVPTGLVRVTLHLVKLAYVDLWFREYNPQSLSLWSLT